MQQRDLEDVEALLQQLRRAGPAEEQAATLLLKEAREFLAKGQWGPTATAYGEAALYKPTTQTLIDYATARVMIDRVRPVKQEALDAKLRDFEGAIKLYRVAIDFGERSGMPLSAEQHREVDEKIACLERFSKELNTAQPGCQLVSDALKVSKIT